MKEILGGRDLNEMTLSEREKVICNLLMKDTKVMENALFVKVNDVLNYSNKKKSRK